MVIIETKKNMINLKFIYINKTLKHMIFLENSYLASKLHECGSIHLLDERTNEISFTARVWSIVLMLVTTYHRVAIITDALLV